MPAQPRAAATCPRAGGYSYDGAGNRKTGVDPQGSCTAVPAVGCTSSGYDVANQLTAVTYSDGVTPNVTNTSTTGTASGPR